jgi:hypothetical protein
MRNQQGETIGATPSHLVTAVFLNEVSARDAIADLKLAGVRANQIGVVLSDEANEPMALNPDAKHLPGDMEGKHSILWRVRHSIHHDVHSTRGGAYLAGRTRQQRMMSSRVSRKSISPTLCGSWGLRKQPSNCCITKWEQRDF